MTNLQNHSGLILSAESVEALNRALVWLRGERGAVSCTVEVTGREGNSPRPVATEVTLTAAGMVTR